MKSALKFVLLYMVVAGFLVVGATAYFGSEGIAMIGEVMKKLLKAAGKMYIWILDFIEHNTFFIFRRAIRVVFVGITVAFISLMAVILFTLHEPALRAIGLIGCTLCYLTALDSIFDDHGLFAFFASISLFPVFSVSLAAIVVGAPVGWVLLKMDWVPIIAIDLGILLALWFIRETFKFIARGIMGNKPKPETHTVQPEAAF